MSISVSCRAHGTKEAPMLSQFPLFRQCKRQNSGSQDGASLVLPAAVLCPNACLSHADDQGPLLNGHHLRRFVVFVTRCHEAPRSSRQPGWKARCSLYCPGLGDRSSHFIALCVACYLIDVPTLNKHEISPTATSNKPAWVL